MEMARAALRLTNRGDPIIVIIAKKIITLAKAGERNPDLLCERALDIFARSRRRCEF